MLPLMWTPTWNSGGHKVQYKEFQTLTGQGVCFTRTLCSWKLQNCTKLYSLKLDLQYVPKRPWIHNWGTIASLAAGYGNEPTAYCHMSIVYFKLGHISQFVLIRTCFSNLLMSIITWLTFKWGITTQLYYWNNHLDILNYTLYRYPMGSA